MTTANESPPAGIIDYVKRWRSPLGTGLFPGGMSERQRRCLLLAEARGFLVDEAPDDERVRVRVEDTIERLERRTADECEEFDGWRPCVYAGLDEYDGGHASRMVRLGEPYTWGVWSHYC